MKGTISPELRAILNNRHLYKQFIGGFDIVPIKDFTITDERGNTITIKFPNNSKYKPRKRRNIFEVLLGK